MLNTRQTGTGLRRSGPGSRADRASQESLRQHNLAVVFASILVADPKRPPSRADLAERTGLTKATVSSLVHQLISLGLVAERAPEAPQGVGRPAVPLTLASRTVLGLGMEVNVDFCGLRVLDLTRTVVAEWIERVDLRDSDPAETLGRLFRAALRIAADVERQGMRIIGTSLALPGLADHPQGPLRLAPNLGWPETDIRSLAEAAVAASDNGLTETGRLRAHQGMVEHLTVDNEANLAARAEALHQGVAGQNRSFIYLSGAIGIGAALVINGEVFRGLHGWAGEIGHTVVDPEGPLCVCGAKGCLEQYAGKRAILRAAGLPLDGGLDALVADSAKGSCATALKEAARALGIALAGAVNLVDITETVIGGDLTPLTEYLADGILSELGNHVVSARWIHPDMIVRPALSGPYPAMTGGAWHALSLVIADPASLLT